MKEWHYSKEYMQQLYDEWKQSVPEWTNPESHEMKRAPHNKVWENNEQGRSMKSDIARLQSEERDNYPRIIEAQNAYIQFLEEYLSKNEEYISALRAFYERLLQEFDEIEKRISDIERRGGLVTIDPDIYKIGSESYYPTWKSDEHYRRMIEDIERLLRDENSEKK